jgi:hypothetical protein
MTQTRTRFHLLWNFFFIDNDEDATTVFEAMRIADDRLLPSPRPLHAR